MGFIYQTPEQIAGVMLDCDAAQLDYRFVEYLNRISDLCRRAGGAIVSRQVIAKAIVDWEIQSGYKARAE